MEYLDGPVLKLGVDFLEDLENRGFIVKSIRAKIVIRSESRSGTRYATYNSVEDLKNSTLPNTDTTDHANWIGDYLVIERLILTNKNIGFTNEFNWFNISSNPAYTKKLQFNSLQHSEYEKVMIKYEDWLKSLVSEYSKNYSTVYAKQSKYRLWTDEEGVEVFPMNWKGIWKDTYTL